MKWSPKKVVGTALGILLIVAGLTTSNPVLTTSGVNQVLSTASEEE